MKQWIRSLSYRDRLEIDYRDRIIFSVFAIGLWGGIDFIKTVRDYRFYAKALADRYMAGEPMDGAFTTMIAQENQDRLSIIFLTLGVLFPLLALLTAIGLYFTSVISRGNISGWNRFMRTLPVNADMRAKSMLYSRGILFGCTLLGCMVVSCSICGLTVDKSTALRLIPVILIIAVIIETADLLVNAIAVRAVLNTRKERVLMVSLLTGLLPLIPCTYLLCRLCPGNMRWMINPDGLSFSIWWIVFLLFCVLLNLAGCLILRKNLASYYE